MNEVETILLVGCSIDGKVTYKAGRSSKEFNKILTKKMSDPINEYRKWADAVIVGRKTVELDNPSLKSAENPKLKRIIIDRDLQLPLDRKVFDNSSTTYIVTTSSDITKLKGFERLGVKIISIEKINFFSDLKEQLFLLGFKKILIEGGGNLNHLLIKHKFIDKLAIAYFPFLVGGEDTPTVLEGPGVAFVENVVKAVLSKFDIIDSNMIFAEYIITYD